MPNDPRGTGTPPFFSNLAIRSRSAELEAPATLDAIEDEADTLVGIDVPGEVGEAAGACADEEPPDAFC